MKRRMLQFSAFHIVSSCDIFKYLFSFFLHLSVRTLLWLILSVVTFRFCQAEFSISLPFSQRKYFSGVMKLPWVVHFSPLRLYDHSMGDGLTQLTCFV